MKTQHPNVQQYGKDKLNLLLQRMSGDFMNTKDRHDIGLLVLTQNVGMFIRMRTFQV